MAVVGVSKTFREAAEGFKTIVRDHTITEETDPKTGFTTITIEGIFEKLDMRSMEMWGGRMRFHFRGEDSPADKDEGFYAMVGVIASQDRDLAAVLTSPTTLRVERLCITKTKTRTETSVWANGDRVSGPEVVEAEAETEEWRDCTYDFALRADPRRGSDW